jgi:hypothetical protein
MVMEELSENWAEEILVSDFKESRTSSVAL